MSDLTAAQPATEYVDIEGEALGDLPVPEPVPNVAAYLRERELCLAKSPKRRIAPPGAMAGEIWIADDFAAPLDGLFDCLKAHPDPA